MSATNRGGERVVNDNYPTPGWLTEAIVPILAPMLPRAPRILEPTCGEGAITRVLKSHLPKARVTEFDIAKPSCSVDFLIEPARARYDLIITNPPYSLAQEFVERSFLWRRDDAALVVMLLRINFLGSCKRAKWLRAHVPSIYVSPRRPAFVKNKHGRFGTDATEYAWFIWKPGIPTLGILHTEERG